MLEADPPEGCADARSNDALTRVRSRSRVRALFRNENACGAHRASQGLSVTGERGLPGEAAVKIQMIRGRSNDCPHPTCSSICPTNPRISDGPHRLGVQWVSRLRVVLRPGALPDLRVPLKADVCLRPIYFYADEKVDLAVVRLFISAIGDT